MKIVSFNLRCRWDNDGINSFIHRIGFIYEKITAEQPDVIAFQEVTAKQKELLDRVFPEYLFVGHGRSPEYKGEGIYTALRKSTCQLTGLDTFWLSPDIYTPGSRFEDQSVHPRICVVTQILYGAEEKVIRIYNTHLDYRTPEVSAQGMQCILDKVTENSSKTPAETVILGDFNTTPDRPAIQLCKQYPLVKLTDITADIPISFHNFHISTHSKTGAPVKFCKIDYIITSPSLSDQVLSVTTWDDCKNGIYLSDHYPVCVQFDI